jgi:hypothetical protein
MNNSNGEKSKIIEEYWRRQHEKVSNMPIMWLNSAKLHRRAAEILWGRIQKDFKILENIKIGDTMELNINLL